MVNIFTDPKARKTPCSISLPNEMWNQIDELLMIRFGNRMSRSAFMEELTREELEAAKSDIRVQSGQTISASAAKSLINRIKDFVHENARNKNIGSLEAIRRPLDELNFFNTEEIRRSRTPTKSDKRHAELVRALMANRDRTRVDELAGSVVIDAPLMNQPALDPNPSGSRHTPTSPREEQEQKPEPDPMDHDYESLLEEFNADFKEDQIPKTDYEIVDEGRTERNPFDKEKKEEVFK